jgi:hypothetical protein
VEARAALLSAPVELLRNMPVQIIEEPVNKAVAKQVETRPSSAAFVTATTLAG